MSGFRTFGTSVQLKELKGELIALRYKGERQIESKPEWSDTTITQSVARADVVHISVAKDKSLKAELKGETLVFQKAIANDIRGTSEWAYGLFEQVERPTPTAPDATMFVLSDTGLDPNALGAAFEAAGIAV